MEKPPVDPIALVGYLLADFDGSQRMASEIAQAMLNVVSGISKTHPVRKAVAILIDDLQVAIIAMDYGSTGRDYRWQFVERWAILAKQIQQTKVH